MGVFLFENEGAVVVVRAKDAHRARSMVPKAEFKAELDERVAAAMKIPEPEGAYDKAFSDWVWKPSNLFGETL